MEKNYFWKINDIVEKITLGVIRIVLLIITFGIILVEFSNIENDTVKFTNYGFGIFLGLASISFSWSRAILENQNNTKERLLECGFHSLYGSLIFLIGSILKYAAMPTGVEYMSFLSNTNNFWHYVPRYLAFYCFFYAIMKINFVIPNMLSIIRESVLANSKKKM